jgi:Mor family transcriptional regulator
MTKDMMKELAVKFPQFVAEPFCLMLDGDGLDAIYQLSSRCHGSDIYIPTLRSIFSDCIEQDILHKYNGSNTRALALHYGYSKNAVRMFLRSNGL